MNPTCTVRRNSGPAITATLAIIVALLLAATAMAAGNAVADPSTAPGWMPPKPTLTAQQKAWLTPMEDHEDQYQILKCSEHREFGECREHGLREQSKDMYAYIFDKEGNYVGTTGAATGIPHQLAPEHIELLDENGILDCNKARNKIPICSDPTGDPAPAKFDEGGKFQELAGDAGTVTPGAGDVDERVDMNKLNPFNAAKEMLDNWFAQACESVGKFAGDLLVLSMSWWLKTDSIDISYAGALNGEKPVQAVVMLIMAAGILSSAIAMMMLRRTGPAAEFAIGAVKFILISSLSLIVLAGALRAGDDFATQITAKGAEEFGPQMQKMLGIATIKNPGGVLLLGVVGVVLSAIQWLFGFARQAGIVVLFALLIFAAAGQLAPWGRHWFPKVASMLTALVLYKPAAAMLYSLGWKLMGTEESLSAVMVGLMVIALTVLSLPTMLAFFSFLAPGVAGGGSAGAALATGVGLAAAGGSTAMNSFGSSGDSHANYMDNTGPNSTPTGPESDPSPGNGGGTGLSSGSGSGSGSGSESGSEAGGDTADMSSADLGPGPAEENPDASGGVGADSGSTVPVGTDAGGSGGAEVAGTEGAAASGGPYGAAIAAGADAVSGTADRIQSVSDSMATEAHGDTSNRDGLGPDMP